MSRLEARPSPHRPGRSFPPHPTLVTQPAPRLFLALFLLGAARIPLQAQAGPWASVMGQGIVSVTHVDPVPGGGTLTEARVVQPVLMLQAGALGGHLGFTGTLNLEGLTIPSGELLPGGWGEGFTDRRHPHTYAHELMLSGNDLLGGMPRRSDLQRVASDHLGGECRRPHGGGGRAPHHILPGLRIPCGSKSAFTPCMRGSAAPCSRLA